MKKALITLGIVGTVIGAIFMLAPNPVAPIGAITTILGTDKLKDSRTTINDNFTDLDTTKMEISTTTLPLITTLNGLISATSLATLNALTSATSLATLSVLTSIGTIGTGVWEGTPVDISAFTNLAVNSPITLTGDTLGFASTTLSIYGISSIMVATTTSDGIATTTEDFLSIRVPMASTIVGFDCYTISTGTSTIRATVASNPLSSGTDILYTTGTQCGADEYIATSTFSTTAVSAGDIIRIYVSDAEPTGSRPGIIYPSFELTKD